MQPLKHVHLVLVCGLLFFFGDSFSQNTFHQNSFNHLNVKDGLSHGLINAICQDEEGFLWIGTYDGLNRFDGKSFKVFKYNRKNPKSLMNNIVHDVCADKEGNIWCSTTSGISRYNKQTDSFDNYVLEDDSTHEKIVAGEGSILCDRQGVIWAGTGSCGLYEFLPEKNQFKNYKRYISDSTSLPSNHIRKHCIAEDKARQGLWVATTRGLCYFDTKTKIAYSYRNNPQQLPVFDNHRIFPVCVTNDNRVVIGDNTSREICFYDIIRNEVVRTSKIMVGKDSTEAANFFCDSKNNLWITAWNYHLWRIDGKTGEYTEVLHDDNNPKSINSTFCWDVFEDKEGTLWFGGLKGISYFNPGKTFYEVFRPDLKVPMLGKQQVIYSSFEDENELLWLATRGAGLISYDFKSGKTNEYSFEENSGIPSDLRNTVTCILLRDGLLYLGTNAGIKTFNRETKKFKYVETIPAADEGQHFIQFLTLQNDSMIWYFDYSNGLHRINLNTHAVTKFHDIDLGEEKVEMDYVLSINADRQQNIWISGSWDGWLKYNAATDSFTGYKVNNNDTNALPEIPISQMVIDSDGNNWVLLRGQGLGRFNPATGKCVTWNSSDGLAFDPSIGLTADRFGRLWIAGYNLLSVFDTKSEKFENYYIEFAENDYNYINNMLTLRNGKIVSGMLGAFVVYDPVMQERKLPIPNILISNFKVFEKSLPFTQQHAEISLSYRENFFTFDYSVVTGVEYDKIEYSYTLEGFDKDWVMAGKRQSAPYTNVPGGDYFFKVKARSSDGLWTQPKTLATIHISKIYYQTWWFRFLVALFMFLIIRFYVRFRNHRQKQEDAEHAIAYFANSEYTNSSPEEILWDLARNCISRLGFVDCVIYMLDEDRQMLIQKAALGEKTPDEKTILNPIEIPVGKGIVGSVASSGKTELISDTSKDPRYIRDDASRLSEIAVPILFDGKTIGVIDSEHPRKNFFNEDHRRILETIASICATKIVNAISSQELVEKEKKLLAIDKRVADLRLMALRAQMNPHFIFNCLNAIDNYILKNDVQNASMYLNKFARLIRTILSESDKSYVTLKSELELLKNYIELENLRFEDKFEFRLSADAAIDLEDTEVPPMLLQPFVENALVHGLIHKKGDKLLSLKIVPIEGALLCIIEDNGIGRAEAKRIKESKSQTHESKGMRVTEGRLELLQQQVKEKGTVTIYDLKDENGNAAGTRVEITIPVE